MDSPMHPQSELDARLLDARGQVYWLYILHGLSLLFSLGVLSFPLVIANYLKRRATAGTFVHSHHDWQISSFWWYLFFLCVAEVINWFFADLVLAILVGVLAWIWKAHSLIKGWRNLKGNQPMPV